MTTGKTLVCPCEDVTEDEVREAVADGYADLESLKRYTALATGPCQGKSCLVLTRRILADEIDVDPARLGTITYRPPTQPVRLGDLAEAADAHPPAGGDPGGPGEGDGGGGDGGEPGDGGEGGEGGGGIEPEGPEDGAADDAVPYDAILETVDEAADPDEPGDHP